MKKLNVFRFTDFLLFLGIGLIVFSIKKNPLFAFIGVCCLFVIAVICLLEKFLHITKSKVESKVGVCVLDEDSDEVKQNFVGEKYGVDGVKTSKGVYKFCTGTHVIIDEKGNVKTKSLTGKLVNLLWGGYLKTAPDDHWKGLFSCEVK